MLYDAGHCSLALYDPALFAVTTYCISVYIKKGRADTHCREMCQIFVLTNFRASMESILLDRETKQLYVCASSVISFTNMLEIKDRVSHAPCRVYTVQCCCV